MIYARRCGTKKIFQIGFNRCATQSLSEALKKIGFKVIHHSDPKVGSVAKVMKSNVALGLPAAGGILSEYDCFLDMEMSEENNFFYEEFKTLDQQNLRSIFIMNTRPVQDWVASRTRLGKTKKDRYYLDAKPEKIRQWVDHYFDHSCSVRNYFRGNTKSSLLVYPIHKMPLGDFLKGAGMVNSALCLNELIVDAFRSDERRTCGEIEYLEFKLKSLGDPSEQDWWA